MINSAEVLKKFRQKWKKGNCPSITSVFAVTNKYLQQRWDGYRHTLELQNKSSTSEEHFHGTRLDCDITTSQKLCCKGSCGICGISCAGMKTECIRKDTHHFQRFGSGFYLAPDSSKCHHYTDSNSQGYHAMLLCDVLPGKKYCLTTNRRELTGPPPGYDSVYGQAGSASSLNYPEIVLYTSRAVMPRYIIVYKQ